MYAAWVQLYFNRTYASPSLPTGRSPSAGWCSWCWSMIFLCDTHAPYLFIRLTPFLKKKSRPASKRESPVCRKSYQTTIQEQHVYICNNYNHVFKTTNNEYGPLISSKNYYSSIGSAMISVSYRSNDWRLIQYGYAY